MKKRFLFRVFVGASSWPVIAVSKKVAKAKFIDRKLDDGEPDDVILEREITSEDEALEKSIDKAQYERAVAKQVYVEQYHSILSSFRDRGNTFLARQKT